VQEVAILCTVFLLFSFHLFAILQSGPARQVALPATGEDDFDVLASGEVVGRIFKLHAAPAGSPWMWTLAFGHHEDRTPTHGYAATGIR